MTDQNPPITRTMDPPAYCAVAFLIDSRDRTEYYLSSAASMDDTARRLLMRWIYADPDEQDLMLGYKRKVTA